MTVDEGRKIGSNWKLTVAYDGTDFYGWQVQPDRATIQGTLADAIERVTGERVLPQGSGRTDAGVHARGQVASFFLEAPIPAENFLRALNRKLPESVRVLQAETVAEDFHARHSAKAKTYEYRIYPVRAGGVCSPWTARYVWALGWPLDVERMREAAALVMGTHDFTSFAASDPDLATRREDEECDDAGNVRTIFESSWTEDGDLLGGLLTYRVRGDGFLHHMVRNLVGTFVDVGRGQLEPAEVARILDAKSRSEAGATAPARGLFLDNVEY
jgi:tRNA pseudouridine38-40 synthase